MLACHAANRRELQRAAVREEGVRQFRPIASTSAAES